MQFPINMAKLYAASLPLGNIMPNMSSVTESLSFGRSSAEVPPRNGVVLKVRIFIIVRSVFKPYFSMNSITMVAVIILVKLATYLFWLQFLANMIYLESMLIIAQDLAEINGAGLVILK